MKHSHLFSFGLTLMLLISQGIKAQEKDLLDLVDTDQPKKRL